MILNLLSSFIESPVATRIGWCLFHSLWQILLVAIAIRVLLGFFGTRNSNARYNIAVIGFILCVALPVATWFSLESPPVVSISKNMPSVGQGAVIEPLKGNAVSTKWNRPEAIEPRAFKPKAFVLGKVGPWLPTLSVVWLFGFVVSALRPFIGLAMVWRLRRTGLSPIDRSLVLTLEKLMASMQIKRSVQLMQSSIAKVPTVAGIFKPMILVPASTLTNLSAAELEAVLAHELAHLRRYDDVVNLIQTFIEAILFYHPGVWWLSAVIRTERENCCDDMAVEVCGESKSLATALLQLEQSRHVQPTLAANGGSLVKRIRRLKGNAMSRKSFSDRINPIYFCSILLALVLAFVVSAGVAVAQQKAEATAAMKKAIAASSMARINVAPTKQESQEEHQEEAEEDKDRGKEAIRNMLKIMQEVAGSKPKQQKVFLGILMSELEGNQGLKVENVVPLSPAQKAGLLRGDIVVAIGEVRIENLKVLQRELSVRKPGDEVAIKILREGQSLVLTTKLANRDDAIVPRADDQRPDKSNKEFFENEFLKLSSKVEIKTDPRNGVMTFIGDPEDVKSLQELITKLTEENKTSVVTPHHFFLAHREASTVSDFIQNYVQTSLDFAGKNVKIESDPKFNSIIVAGANLHDIEKIGQLIKLVDAPAQPGPSLIRLEHAKSDDIAKYLKSYFDSLQGVPKQKVRIKSENRSNSVIVSGSIEIVKQIEGMIVSLDQPNVELSIVVLATDFLDESEMLSPKNTKIELWPKRFIPKNAITDIGEISDMRTTRPVPKGSALTKEMIGD